MYKIEYDIGVNSDGRPYIALPEGFGDKPQDKFYVFEIVYYLLQELSKKYENIDGITKNDSDKLYDALSLIGQISDELSEIIYEKDLYNDNLYDEDDDMNNPDIEKVLVNVIVNNLNERDELPPINIKFDNKLIDRFIGMKVLVIEEEMIYVLKNGITNKHWVEYGS